MLSLHRIVLTSVVLAAILIGSIHAQKGQKPGGGGGSNTLFPVTAEFRCPTSADCFTLDQIEGDTLGPYRGTTPAGSATTQEGQAANMGGYLTEGNLFLFVLKSGLGRTISLAFTRTNGTAPCVGAGNCRKNFTTAVSDETPHGSRTYPVDAMGTDLPNGFASIPVGQSARARMFLNFADPSGRALLWTVRFDPRLYPGSTHLTVTRTAANQWIIEAGDSDIAELVSATTSKGKSVIVNEGYYAMPFRITVTQ